MKGSLVLHKIINFLRHIEYHRYKDEKPYNEYKGDEKFFNNIPIEDLHSMPYKTTKLLRILGNQDNARFIQKEY